MAAVGIKIAGVILSAANLAYNVTKTTEKSVPDASSTVKNKHRWIQCTIKNKTQFQIVLLDTYWSSGRYDLAPGGASAFDQIVFDGCNGDNTFLTGVSGGNSFRIVLDATHSFDVAFGWTSPQAGPFTVAAVESSKPVDGYNKASSTGNNFQSANTYVAKDENGVETKIQFHVSASPGQKSLFVITQIRLN